MIKIYEAHELRAAVFAKLLEPSPRSEYAAQHDVWPCVRKGAGERWLAARGIEFPPSKSAGLYFLRGKSAEGIITGTEEEQQPLVYNGVSTHQDLNRSQITRIFEALDPETVKRIEDEYGDIVFAEIKSTNFSSAKFYKIVKAGGITLEALNDFEMKNYIQQCANYCVATRTRRCFLIVYYLHGDYADRRTKCPECGNRLGEWVDDFYKECVGCGYKSKKIDLWAYVIEFDDRTLITVEREVFGVRPKQFYRAIEAETETELKEHAPASPNFYCRSCRVGEALGCENFGKEYR